MRRVLGFLSLLLAAPALASSGDERAVNSEMVAISSEVVTASGLKYSDLKPGTGDLAKKGDTVEVHYIGWLADGKKFDSSVDRKQPFAFKLGAGLVIKGFDEGITGMKIGGKRRLVIPPEIGYGARGAGNAVPPNAIMIFEVELLRVN